MTRRLAGAVALSMTLLAAACNGDTASDGTGAEATPDASAAAANPAAFVEGEPYEPAIDPDDFVREIDHPYLPLRPGTRWELEGTSDGEEERSVVEVTDDTKTVLGVETTVVRDRVYVDGELAEDTLDWFAQDEDGNVWYFGEESKDYEDGRVSSTEGSWEAGVDGAQPGIVMLADPEAGQTYRQEYCEGEAEDIGKVLELGAERNVPFGEFDDVLVTQDTTPLEPDVVEQKYYARGVGLIEERHVRGGEGALKLVALER